MKKFILIILGLVIAVNLVLSAFFVLNRDVDFHSDVARDFLLYQEIDAKKIILIGPRSSTAGIFHGPLWLYFTYPAYLLGKGDPITVAWFWVIASAVFVGSSAAVAKKLFNSQAALIYAVLLSANMVFQTNKSLFNPHGALFLIPVYFFTVYLYQRDRKWWQLLLHLFIGSLMIQFQMAIGIPFVILSSLYILYLIFHHRRFWHLVTFLIIPVCLLNFLIFELRHDFSMTKAIAYYTLPNSNGMFFDYTSQIDNRLERLMDLRLVGNEPSYLAGFLFAIVIFLTYHVWRKPGTDKTIYRLFFYYFFGYTLLTFINKGAVLEHQFFPVFALTNLWFASLIASRKRKLFWVTTALIVIFTYRYFWQFADNANRNFFDRAQSSWKFLSRLSQTAAGQAPRDFGFFVYSPDGFAYQPRYALIYWFNRSGKNASEFRKEPVTFIIAAPAPFDKPWFNHTFWQSDKIKIKNLPFETWNFPNGYLVEKFLLSNADAKIAPNPEENIGIHFR